MVRAATLTAVSASISTPVWPWQRTVARISRRQAAASSKAKLTDTCVTIRGWQSGIRSAVRLAARMPATRCGAEHVTLGQVARPQERQRLRAHAHAAGRAGLPPCPPPCRPHPPCGPVPGRPDESNLPRVSFSAIRHRVLYPRRGAECNGVWRKRRVRSRFGATPGQAPGPRPDLARLPRPPGLTHTGWTG